MSAAWFNFGGWKLVTAFFSSFSTQTIGFFLLLIFLIYLRNRSIKYHEHRRLNSSFERRKKSDYLLIQAVIARGLSENEASYMLWLGDKLAALTESAETAKVWSRRLAIVGFAGGGLSSLITGAGFFGALTVPLSFLTTSIGTFALGILTLLSLGDKAMRQTLLTERIRLELANFLASAVPYANVYAIEQEFQIFCLTISGLLSESIIEDAEASEKLQKSGDVAVGKRDEADDED